VLGRTSASTFEEIPAGELRAVGRYVSETLHLESGSDEHLRSILEYYELKRLTTQVGTRLLEILDRPDESVVPLLDTLWCRHSDEMALIRQGLVTPRFPPAWRS
jgi:hypothetical protein